MKKDTFSFSDYVRKRRLFEEEEVSENALDSMDPHGSRYPLLALEDAINDCIEQGVERDTILNIARMLTSTMDDKPTRVTPNNTPKADKDLPGMGMS